MNPQTRLPVQIELTGKFGGGQTWRSTISDFELDPKLEDALFSLDPPQGYTLADQEPHFGQPDKDDGSPETAVVKLLRSTLRNPRVPSPSKLMTGLVTVKNSRMTIFKAHLIRIL